MRLSDLFDKNAFFKPEIYIKEYIKNSKNYEGESTSNANVLKFFSTSKQRTYLVFTDKKVYCILDDNRKSKPNINWSEKLTEYFKRDNIDKVITTKDKTDNTGLVDFGQKHKNWLFTKSLFNDFPD